MSLVQTLALARVWAQSLQGVASVAVVKRADQWAVVVFDADDPDQIAVVFRRPTLVPSIVPDLDRESPRPSYASRRLS